MRRVLLTVVCGLALAGCGSGQTAAPAPTSTAALPSTTTATAAPSPTTTSPATTAPATTTPAAPKPSCPETAGWGTGDVGSDVMSRDALYLVRAGRHACYDRVVFTLNGTAPAGYVARYVPVVTSDPKGDPLPVPGGAALEVVVRAPALGTDDAGHQPGRVLAAIGDTLVSTPAWPSLRAVRFAGSFEGQSTFAVGVRAKLGFRVFTFVDARNALRLVVVDIAH